MLSSSVGTVGDAWPGLSRTDWFDVNDATSERAETPAASDERWPACHTIPINTTIACRHSLRFLSFGLGDNYSRD